MAPGALVCDTQALPCAALLQRRMREEETPPTFESSPPGFAHSNPATTDRARMAPLAKRRPSHATHSCVEGVGIDCPASTAARNGAASRRCEQGGKASFKLMGTVAGSGRCVKLDQIAERVAGDWTCPPIIRNLTRRYPRGTRGTTATTSAA